MLTLIGYCLTDVGKTQDAEAIFRKVIANGIDINEAISGLTPIYKFKAGDPELAAVEKLLITSANRPATRKSLLFAKAKILDDTGQTGAAVAAAVEAKSNSLAAGVVQ